MENLIIKPTDETPEIVLDPSKNAFTFKGRSLPEDVLSFYSPVLNWFDEYIKEPNPETEIHFKLDYFNTASSKVILDILLKLEDVKSSKSKLTIKWYYDADDLDMKEAGEGYAEIVDLPFEYLPIEG